MGDLDLDLELVIQETIGAYALLNKVGWDSIRVDFKNGKDGNASCFILSLPS